MLAFEPPVLGAASTLGGVVASGLAGPRRPFAGAVRDFVLGVTVLDGRGDALRLGGTVFKNVAGFDGFRLMAGAQGCLGALLDVSLRVSPASAAEATVTIGESWPAAKARLGALMSRQTPLSAAMHDGDRLHLRFSGSEGRGRPRRLRIRWRNLAAAVAGAAGPAAAHLRQSPAVATLDPAALDPCRTWSESA